MTEQAWTLDGAYALYVAVPPDGDAARVEVLLGGGPEVRQRKQNQPRHRFDWHSDVKIWPGGVVGQCVGASRSRPRRAAAPARIRRSPRGRGRDAAPADPPRDRARAGRKLREMVAQNMHAGWEFIKPMKWLAVRYDAAPLPLKTPAKLTVTYRAANADAAHAVVVAWTHAIDRVLRRRRPRTGRGSTDRAQLTPTVDGDRAVLSIEADEIPRLIAEGRPAIRNAWRLPPPTPSTRSARRDDARRTA